MTEAYDDGYSDDDDGDIELSEEELSNVVEFGLYAASTRSILKAAVYRLDEIPGILQANDLNDEQKEKLKADLTLMNAGLALRDQIEAFLQRGDGLWNMEDAKGNEDGRDE